MGCYNVAVAIAVKVLASIYWHTEFSLHVLVLLSAMVVDIFDPT